MSESITVQQADIHTAAVEVAIMRISGKQVTLSVFRQLKSEPVVDADGHFVGLPWGTVNYHPAKECDGADGEHVHVVWQRGNELRRGTMRYPLESTPSPSAAEEWLVSASADGWRPADDRRSGYIRIKSAGGVFGVHIPRDLAEFWGWEQDSKSEHEYRRRSAQNWPRDHPEPAGVPRDELLADVVRETREHYERQTRRAQRWTEVQELPQLFIAV